MDNRDIISIVFSHLLCWINRVLIQSNKCLIHANYPLFPLTFLQHFITCYLASIHLDILIYIYIYSFHVLVSLYQCCKSHQKISHLSEDIFSNVKDSSHSIHFCQLWHLSLCWGGIKFWRCWSLCRGSVVTFHCLKNWNSGTRTATTY